MLTASFTTMNKPINNTYIIPRHFFLLLLLEDVCDLTYLKQFVYFKLRFVYFILTILYCIVCRLLSNNGNAHSSYHQTSLGYTYIRRALTGWVRITGQSKAASGDATFTNDETSVAGNSHNNMSPGSIISIYFSFESILRLID